MSLDNLRKAIQVSGKTIREADKVFSSSKMMTDMKGLGTVIS